MYTASFEYHRAGSVQDALALLDQYGDEAKILAGGHSLIPVMKLRFAQPSHLVDITRIPGLAGVTESGGVVQVGATTRHADVVSSPVLRVKAPLLAETASHIGDPLIRNAGTIGGSIAHADPSADLPAALFALGARMVVSGRGGERTIAVDDFFTDVFTTSMKPGEILIRVDVPVAGAGSGSAYEENPDPASGYAIVGIASQLTVSAGKITAAGVGMTGLASKPLRLSTVESALVGQAAVQATVDSAASRAADGIDFIDDARGDAAYKANLARVFAKRSLTRALARALGT